VDLDEFKRVARQPSEAEQWLQMIPFASLLSRCLGTTALDELENFQEGQWIPGLRVFFQGVQALLQQRLRKLKDQNKKLRLVQGDDETKFGGVLEGGSVDDFHHGLSDRLGKNAVV